MLGILQVVLVRYVDRDVFICANQNRLDMKKKGKSKVVTVDMYHKYAEIDEMYGSKVRDLKLDIPSNLRMLCAILHVKVEKLLNDFMWMLSYSHHNSATAKQRRLLINFFLLANMDCLCIPKSRSIKCLVN